MARAKAWLTAYESRSIFTASRRSPTPLASSSSHHSSRLRPVFWATCRMSAACRDGIGDCLSRVDSDSDVQVADLAGLAADEVASRLDLLAHEGAEDLVCLRRVAHLDLEERPRVRVHGRLPQLVGVHLAEALEALDGNVLRLAVAGQLLDRLVALLLIAGVSRHLAGADPVERRLADVEVAAIDDLGHVAGKVRWQQR